MDLFLTKDASSFQNIKTISTYVTDLHTLALTVLKTSAVKRKSREILFKKYKFFGSRKFNRDLKK